MRKILKILFLTVGYMQSVAQSKYEVNIDLGNIKNDKVKVEVLIPPMTQKNATWCIPAIVPGTYSKYDFGRFISHFRAFDKQGSRLKTKKISINQFAITHSENLHRVTYLVSDTWDAPVNQNYVFQPAGTNIEKDKCIVFNPFGFIGYLEGIKNLPYQLNFEKPANFYANTSLKVKQMSATKDVMYATNYNQLADSPTLYCEPDTVSLKCKNSTIHISVYTTSHHISAKKIQKCIAPLSNALASFFNVLPVNDYHFLFYFAGVGDKKVWGNGANGALEHNYSSFYFLPELVDTSSLFALVKDVSAHEFLHILTPLNVHSFEIENFDFIKPIMSEHLWMYEGVTEYFAHLVQLQGSLFDEEKFMDNMKNKIQYSSEYPNFSFTEMSKKVCEYPYIDYYDNVYQKGALLAFLLDIQLTQLSNCKFGLPELMTTLSKKYGPEKPFVDSTLFAEIVTLTHPKINDFFKDYIIGQKELPYKDLFDKIGWNYQDSLVDSVYNFGKFGITAQSDKDYLKVIKTEEDLNLFGMKTNDHLVAINKKKVDALDWTLLEPILHPKTNDIVTLSIIRKGKNIELTATPRKRSKTLHYIIKPQTELSLFQKEMRQKLFGFKIVSQKNE